MTHLRMFKIFGCGVKFGNLAYKFSGNFFPNFEILVLISD
jgi:hypothetical protein